MLRLTMTALAAGMFLASCGGNQTETKEASHDQAEGDHTEHAAEMAEEVAANIELHNQDTADEANGEGEGLIILDKDGNQNV